MMPVAFERSGPNLKPVAYCDHEGCAEFGLFGFNSHLGQAIDRKDVRLAGKHFCRQHVHDAGKKVSTNPYMGE